MRSLARWMQQRDPGLFVPLEAVLRPRRSIQGASPMIIVAAPPRSGSTLLYQLLVHGLEVNYISNLHYTLYRQPYTAHYAGRLLLTRRTSDFRSHYGFVPGLNGPAEAERFWQYWFDQHLQERDPAPTSQRLQRILSFFRWLFSQTGKPFVAGYIGHALYLPQMLQHCPDTLAICLHRDLVSVAYSLLIGRSERQGDRHAWWTVRPRECIGAEALSPHEQVATQAFHIDRKLREQQTRLGPSVLTVEYAQLCENPSHVIERVRSALNARGFDVPLRRDTQIPTSFRASVHSHDANEDTRLIVNALDILHTGRDLGSRHSETPRTPELLRSLH